MPHAFRTVEFKSKDGLLITADLYAVKKPKGLVVLCHRSHFNRGEYRESAPRIAALGFTCLAIDQRSGMNVLGIRNETSSRAKDKGLPTGYLDARPDIEAAVDYLYRKGRRPIILIGSSYSAALALLIANDNPKVKAVAVFSPGEYLKGLPVAESLKGWTKPVYITSAMKELTETIRLMRFVHAKHKTWFKPKVAGAHGARALWEATEGHQAYWTSLTNFLLGQG